MNLAMTLFGLHSVQYGAARARERESAEIMWSGNMIDVDGECVVDVPL